MAGTPRINVDGLQPEPIIFQFPNNPDNLDPAEARDWMSRNDRRLQPHVVDVPRAWRKAVLPTHRFPRDCFARAIYFIHSSPHMPQALYVIGETVGGGMQQHGWVEIDDSVVFDAVMQQFYDKAGYYTAELANPWYRFTRPAMMYLRRTFEKQDSWSYRWDAVLGLPWARDPANPLLVDLTLAKEFWRAKQEKRSGGK